MFTGLIYPGVIIIKIFLPVINIITLSAKILQFNTLYPSLINETNSSKLRVNRPQG